MWIEHSDQPLGGHDRRARPAWGRVPAANATCAVVRAGPSTVYPGWASDDSLAPLGAKWFSAAPDTSACAYGGYVAWCLGSLSGLLRRDELDVTDVAGGVLLPSELVLVPSELVLGAESRGVLRPPRAEAAVRPETVLSRHRSGASTGRTTGRASRIWSRRCDCVADRARREIAVQPATGPLWPQSIFQPLRLTVIGRQAPFGWPASSTAPARSA